MKKILTITLLLVITVAMMATTSMAATNDDLIEYIKADHKISGKMVGITAENRVKAERYLKENPVTDSQADAIIAKGNDLIALMESEGVSDPARLSYTGKEKFMALAQQAADVVGAKLVFHPHSVDVYKDGTLIDTVTLGGKLVYTGNSVNLALVISSIATIALATGFVAKKRFANA